MLMSIVGMFFLSFFGLNALFNSQYVLASYVLITAFIGIGNITLIFSRYSRLSIFNLSVLCGFLILMLIGHGGIEKTGILWTYSLLTISVAILPFKLGCIFCSIFVTSAFYLMLIPNNHDFLVDYTITESTRYIASSLALCVLTLTFVKIQENTKKVLRRQSITDELTGLYNRSVVKEKRVAKLGKVTATVLLVDIDFFKLVNDEYGHDTGDKVLIAVSEIIKSEVRDNDLAIRWGGEEFLLILKNCSLEQAVQKASSISKRVQKDAALFELVNKEITLSIGAACIDEKTELYDAIKTADQNLYVAKNSGRNKIVDTNLRFKSVSQ